MFLKKLSCLWLLFLIASTRSALADADLKIHYLNVGTGMCQVVECPCTGQNCSTFPIIFDCGSAGGSAEDMDKTETINYVRDILDDYSSPPIVVISHPHNDHHKYIVDIMADTDAQEIWLGGPWSAYMKSSLASWLKDQQNDNVSIRQGFPAGSDNNGSPIITCGDAEVYMLTVNAGKGPNANSLVAQLVYGEFSAIFAGDAEKSTQKSAIANADNLNMNIETTIMSAPHHGAATHGSNNSAWVKATSPEVVIFNAGTKYHHPRCETVEAYRQSSNIRNTPSHLIWCGKKTSTGLKMSSFKAKKAEYVTEKNGVILVSVADEGGDYAISCSRSENCF